MEEEEEEEEEVERCVRGGDGLRISRCQHANDLLVTLYLSGFPNALKDRITKGRRISFQRRQSSLNKAKSGSSARMTQPVE